MEKKRTSDYSGGNISKSPELKTTDNGSGTITPKNRILLDRGKSNTPSSCYTVSRASPRRRSVSSTPESSTKRELKKLEDYWTRNDPVKDDSPRLRSNRKVIFNQKDCLGESNKRKRSPRAESVPQNCNGVDQICLPESPIPGLHNKAAANLSDTVPTYEKKSKSHNAFISGSPNIFTTMQSCFSVQSQSVSLPTSQTKMFTESSPVPKKNETQTHCGEIKPTCDLTASHLSDTDQDISKHDTSSDSDDDDYIPPRKKLRSEVSKDELWDGIPLAVSFKRLAPISKSSMVKPAELLQRIKQKPTAIREYKGIDQETIKDNKVIENGTELKKGAEEEYSTYSTEPKRSSRLREKLTGTPITKEESSVNTVSSDCHIVCTTSDFSKPDRHGCPIVIKEMGSASHSNENNENSHNTSQSDIETCSKKLNVSNNHADGSFTGDILLKLTVSQILTVDSQSDEDESNELKDDDIEKDGCLQDKENTDSPTSASTSISKTINEIFDDISGPNELSQRPENRNGNISDTCDIVENDLKITRRSRRLNDLEKRKSVQKLPSSKATEDDQDKPCAGTSTGLNYSLEIDEPRHVEEDNVFIGTTTDQSSSKHKLFTKNTKKCTKTVPPLRIKLKQPIKGVVKNKCHSRPKQKTSTLKNKSKVKMRNESKEEVSEKEDDLFNLNRKEVTDAAPRQASVAEKKGFTPKNKKKKISKQRTSRSPPPLPPSDSIALRLHNERRLSAAGNLLSNPVLNKHACVLWSSENRRHVQLSNPKASISELDSKLSLKWDRLSDKEKLKYFQRARDAIKDENRHSSRRHNTLTEDNTSKDMAAKFSDESSNENFVKLTPASQMTEIKKWLNFYNDVSSEVCSEVISSFKQALVEENRKKAKKEIELEKSKTKSKKNKQKRKEARLDSTDSNFTYRKILFEKILAKKENIKDVLTEMKKAQHKSILDSYSGMLRRMVCGEVVHFAGDVKSDKLSETLVDVKALEKESKLAVTGDRCESMEYDAILARLSTRSSPDGKGLVCALEKSDVNDGHIENICQQIQNFPSLSPRTLENNLPEVFISESEAQRDLIYPPRRTSPVMILNEWVADDLIAYQPQIGFRKAISLLSNKIVPSPTIILPPKAVNGSRSTANRSQNCNIVFTKLQKARPSVLTAKVDLLN